MNLKIWSMSQRLEEHFNYHNLRSNRCWEISKVRTINFGTETMRYRGPKIKEMLPPNIKVYKSLEEFKLKIKHGNLPTAHVDYVKNLCIIKDS